MPGIHAEVLEVWAESRTWEEFEGRLLKKYRLDDVLQLLKRDFMEWVESPDKGRNVSLLLREFEERFAQLSELNRPFWTRVLSYCLVSRWASGIRSKWVSYWKPKTG